MESGNTFAASSPVPAGISVDRLESKFGVNAWLSPGLRRGYLFNIKYSLLYPRTTASTASSTRRGHAGIHLYFVTDEGTTWRTSFIFRPYFYVGISDKAFMEPIKSTLMKKLEKLEIEIQDVERSDLAAPNHLAFSFSKTNRVIFLKLSFSTIEQLKLGREEIRALIRKNKLTAHKKKENDRFGSNRFSILYTNESMDAHSGAFSSSSSLSETTDALQHVYEIYESTVRYVSRVCIDTRIRCGCWYEVHRKVEDLHILPQ
ncbi:hypothetical protein IE077_001744, partial [Cardiosporidium cionae]